MSVLMLPPHSSLEATSGGFCLFGFYQKLNDLQIQGLPRQRERKYIFLTLFPFIYPPHLCHVSGHGVLLREERNL